MLCNEGFITSADPSTIKGYFMTMDPLTLAGVGLVLFLAAAAQGAVGFGYALFATPLLVLLGIPLQNVVVLVSTCSMIQCTLAAHHLRAHIPWSIALTATAIRLVAVIVGLVGLKQLMGLDPDRVRLAIGIFLCILVLLQWAWHPAPVERVNPFWSGLAFTASGLLAGLLGMGGPPLILWVMAHRWSSLMSRAFLFAVVAMSVPAQLVIMTFGLGTGVLKFIAIGLAASPLVYAGSRLGLPVGNRLSRERLRMLAYGLLLIIGASAIWRALVS